MEQLVAFHGDPKVKRKYLARVRAHAKADEIIKGQYWQGGKGCAVGCTIHSSLHSAYERELGIPAWLARVEDRLFEGMPDAEAKKWPAKFLAAIKPGVDLEKAKGPFLIFVLESTLNKFDHAKFPKVKELVERAVALWKTGGTPEEFRTARAAAFAADAAAAYAADAAAAYAAAAYADAAAAYAAAAYAAAAAADAADAADAAAFAADAAYAAAVAARQNTYKKFSLELLRILKGLK